MQPVHYINSGYCPEIDKQINLFPETHIVFFVILRKTPSKFYPPVLFKLHTGFSNCVVCRLYSI